MCGIFGALAVEKNAQLNIAVLEELAVINETRGRHAFGFASTNNKTVKNFKGPGRPSVLSSQIREHILPNATAFIGHTRHATHGDPEDNKNNHPHNVPMMVNGKKLEGFLVHNGTVKLHERLVQRYALPMRTNCDSEVIAKLLSSRRLFANTGSGRLSILKRATLTAEAIDCPSSFLFVSPRRFAAVRMDRPLWWHKYEGVVYFSSIPLDFETDYARGSVSNNAVRTYHWSAEDGRWKLAGRGSVHRGKRGKEGAARTTNELSIDWRQSASPSRNARGHVDHLLADRLRHQRHSLIPHWKQVAEDFKNAPIDTRPEADSHGKRITYLANSRDHAPRCTCVGCLRARGVY